jgi:hypothetical protein
MRVNRVTDVVDSAQQGWQKPTGHTAAGAGPSETPAAEPRRCHIVMVLTTAVPHHRGGAPAHDHGPGLIAALGLCAVLGYQVIDALRPRSGTVRRTDRSEALAPGILAK